MRKVKSGLRFYRCSRLVCAGITSLWVAVPVGTLAAGDRMAGEKHDNVRLVQFTGEAETSENSVTSAFKKAGSSIQGFFTPKPRASRIEDDPVSLSSMPEEVGASVYLSAARMMENAGNVEGAERQYQACLEKHPQHRMALISYGRLLHRSQRLEQSLEIYQLAIEHHPEDATLHNDLGLCLARMERQDEAMAHFHKASVLAPEDPRYRNNLAMVLVDVGRFDEALSQLIYAHGEAKGHYNLGYLRFRKGDSAGASQCFQAALQLDPELKPAAQMLQRIAAAGEPEPRTAQAGRTPPAPNAMFISDQPEAAHPASEKPSKIPPAPELEAPRLLPPVQ